MFGFSRVKRLRHDLDEFYSELQRMRAWAETMETRMNSLVGRINRAKRGDTDEGGAEPDNVPMALRGLSPEQRKFVESTIEYQNFIKAGY